MVLVVVVFIPECLSTAKPLRHTRARPLCGGKALDRNPIESQKAMRCQNIQKVPQFRFGAKALDGQNPNFEGGNRGGSDSTHLYTEVWCNASQEACTKAGATDNGEAISIHAAAIYSRHQP